MDHRQQNPTGLVQGRPPVCGPVSSEPPMRLTITSTTGSRVELSVPRGETVEGLRACLSQKLRLPRDKIVLLYKDRKLNAGKLLDLGVADQSKFTLVPPIETGLATSRTERTMMQALESLTESQISDFLSGQSPLTLSLGIGAHVMYVQVQLAAQNVAGQQQHRHPVAWSSSKLQAGPAKSVNVTHPGSTWNCSSADAPASLTTPPSQTLSPAPRSPSPSQLGTRRPETSLHLSTSTSHLSNKIPVICRRHHSPAPHSYPGNSIHSSSPVPSTPSLPPGCPPPSSPCLPTAPFCSPSPTCFNPGPQSPVPASTFPESNQNVLSATKLCEEPGAVIESFVNHSPGVFSGTFSGTLAPYSQSGIGHPRPGIAIILQILNDLLSATRDHEGAPPTLSQLHCPGSSLPVKPLLKTDDNKASSKPLMTQGTEPRHFSKPAGGNGCPQQSSTEDNLTLRCKLERLQFLMHQRRLCRRTRNGRHPSQNSHPYQHRHSHPWSTGRQKTANGHTSGSPAFSNGTSPDDLKLQVTEEPPWKPELTSDLVVV
ncbi:midnolin-B-like [Polymixia lowei]